MFASKLVSAEGVRDEVGYLDDPDEGHAAIDDLDDDAIAAAIESVGYQYEDHLAHFHDMIQREALDMLISNHRSPRRTR